MRWLEIIRNQVYDVPYRVSLRELWTCLYIMYCSSLYWYILIVSLYFDNYDPT